MIIVTTSSIEGKKIKEYKGLITKNEVGIGTGFNIAEKFRETINNLYNIAINEMIKEANEKGCNAIVGVTFTVTSVGDSRYFIVTMTGTGVVVE